MDRARGCEPGPVSDASVAAPAPLEDGDSQICVVLCQLYSSMQPPDAEPLSIEALGGALLESGLPVMTSLVLVDERIPERSIDAALNLIAKANPTIVGLSVPQGTAAVAVSLMGRLRSEFDRGVGRATTIVAGHALPSARPERFLACGADIVVIGWGESALVSLVRRVVSGVPDLSEIPGIAYRDSGGTIRRNAIGSWAPADAPPPRVPGGQRFFRRVEASRGCHYGHCRFCARPAGPPDLWLPLEVERVVADIRALVDQGVRSFTFTDEDFFGNDPMRAREIVRRIRELAPVEFTACLRADSVQPREGRGVLPEDELTGLLAELRDSGMVRVFLGVESLSATQLARYGKRQKVEWGRRAVSVLRELGIDVEIGFIPFDPRVTLQELRDDYAGLIETDLYKHIGTPFGWLRIQDGSDLARRHRRDQPQSKEDPETLELAWQFVNEDSARVFHMLRRWWDDVDQLYLLARSLYRSMALSGDRRRGIAQALERVRLRACVAALSAIEAVDGSAEPRPDDDSVFDIRHEFDRILGLLSECHSDDLTVQAFREESRRVTGTSLYFGAA